MAGSPNPNHHIPVSTKDALEATPASLKPNVSGIWTSTKHKISNSALPK
jgi:hypothetical protein